MIRVFLISIHTAVFVLAMLSGVGNGFIYTDTEASDRLDTDMYVHRIDFENPPPLFL